MKARKWLVALFLSLVIVSLLPLNAFACHVDVAVDCKGAYFRGATPRTTLSYRLSDGQSGKVTVVDDFEVFIPWKPSINGQYGPFAVWAEATLAINGASGRAEENLICGVPQASISAKVSCEGVEVSGNTDVATIVNWKFQNESGSHNVVPGDFSFAAGTALDTYGPHSLSGSASMEVGETTFSDSDSQNGAICGVPVEGSPRIAGMCRVDGRGAIEVENVTSQEVTATITWPDGPDGKVETLVVPASESRVSTSSDVLRSAISVAYELKYADKTENGQLPLGPCAGEELGPWMKIKVTSVVTTSTSDPPVGVTIWNDMPKTVARDVSVELKLFRVDGQGKVVPADDLWFDSANPGSIGMRGSKAGEILPGTGIDFVAKGNTLVMEQSFKAMGWASYAEGHSSWWPHAYARSGVAIIEARVYWTNPDGSRHGNVDVWRTDVVPPEYKSDGVVRQTTNGTYTVQNLSGMGKVDTLAQIAKSLGVSIFDLAAANDLVDVNVIHVGQVLVVPPAG